MKKKLLNLKGNFVGGMSATILALPESIAYGTLAMAPLGDKYISAGAITGLLSLVFLNFGSSLLGKKSIINSGPFSLASLMVASTLTFILKSIPVSNNYISTALTLLFLVIFMAGIIQVIFGLFKIGNLTRYIPYPVISGLLSGTCILIFTSQVGTFFGLKDKIANIHYSDFFSGIQWFTLLTGVVTIISMKISKKYLKKIPDAIVGIIGGSLFYYLIKFIVPQVELGPVICKIPFKIPTPDYIFKFKDFIFSGELSSIVHILPELFTFSAGIAILLTLRNLIALLAIDSKTLKRSNSNMELVSQGFGNMLSSLFGGISGCGSISRTLASHESGSTSGLSKLFSGLTALSILMFLYPLVSKIPMVVLAALLMNLSFAAFDRWTFKQLPFIFSKKSVQKKEACLNISLVMVVILTMIYLGIFQAVAIGIAASLVLFVLQMNKDVIRREFDGNKYRSNVERTKKETTYLEKHGERIRILELEGTLFFGTADKLSLRVGKLLSEKIDYMVIDFCRIGNIDATGERIINQLRNMSKQMGKHILLCSLNCQEPNYKKLYRSQDCFDSLDDGLAWAEDNLIEDYRGETYFENQLSIKEIDTFKDLSMLELTTLRGYLAKETFERGKKVFQENDPGNKIYFILQGKAHIIITIQMTGAKKRIKTLCPGTFFGEMALIDGEKRSATVMSDNNLVCLTMTDSKFRSFSKDYPEMANKIFSGISSELSRRIRISNKIISQLKR